jgi:hypothetical protein
VIRDVAAAAIRDLHWADLEALVDIMLARSGYNRISALGGSQRDYDLVVEHVGTGEVLRVQVKTAGTNAMLQSFVSELQGISPDTRGIFVCHSPRETLTVPDGPIEI